MGKLFQENIILIKELAALGLLEIKRLLPITEKKAADLKEAADTLCFCLLTQDMKKEMTLSLKNPEEASPQFPFSLA